MNKPQITRVVPLLLAAATLLLARERAAAQAARPAVDQRWYRVLLEGKPAGWFHESFEPPDAKGEIHGRTQMQVTIRRGPVSIETGIDGRSVETREGKPIRLTLTQKLGATATTQELIFGSAGTELVNRQGDRETRTKLEEPKGEARGWLPPAAALRHTREQVARGAKEISYWSMDPSVATQPVKSTLVRQGEEKVEVLGKVVPATVWEMTTSALPNMVMKCYLNERGDMVKSTLPLMPGMDLTLIEADEAIAKAQINPPEMLTAMLVRPEGTIKDPRRLRKAVYEVTMAGGKPGAATTRGSATRPAGEAASAQGDLTQTAVQSVTRDPARPDRVKVTIDLDGARSGDAPGADGAYLKASTVLDRDDPKIRGLVEQALKGKAKDAPAAEKAEALRQFVGSYIEAKDLSVGFATATEVARTAQGDCTEHAVLLAAMLRAAEIPSRTVTGLVYVDQFMNHEEVFGYHMWAEGWIDPDGGGPKQARWVDLDGTLGPETPFDAAHIALGTSAMSDESTANDMVRIMPLMGRLSIRIDEPAAAPAGR